MNQEQRAAARARCEAAAQFPYTGLPANLARPALLEDLPAALDALDARDAEIARLRAALEWFASDEPYRWQKLNTEIGDTDGLRVAWEGRERARAALTTRERGVR